MLSAGLRFNPADVSVLAAIDHVQFARSAVLEHQRIRIPEIHEHHRIGNARLRYVDPGLRNDGRMLAVDRSFLSGLCARREDRVAGALDKLVGSIALMLAKAL